MIKKLFPLIQVTQRFIQLESSSAILLFLSTLVALLWSNLSPVQDTYHRWIENPFFFLSGNIHFLLTSIL